jgi:hypothetical protein
MAISRLTSHAADVCDSLNAEGAPIMCCRRAQILRPVLLSIAVLLLGAPTMSLPQEPTLIAVGSHIRVKAEVADQRWIVGELLESPIDSVRIRQENSAYTVALAMSSLTQFERSLEQRRQGRRGALIGLGVGVGLGLILGAASDGGECSEFCEIDPSTGATGVVLGGLVGGLFGAGVGALIGGSIETDRWEPVPRPWAGGSRVP